MSIAPDYCRQNPEWAARRIDELEEQLQKKFFMRVASTVQSTHPYDKGEGVTEERIAEALSFADAIDYAYGKTGFVDTVKALAWAVRSNAEAADERREAAEAPITDIALLKAYSRAHNGKQLTGRDRALFLNYARIGIACATSAAIDAARKGGA